MARSNRLSPNGKKIGRPRAVKPQAPPRAGFLALRPRDEGGRLIPRHPADRGRPC